MDPQVCVVCHLPLNENFYFCPNCGKKIKEPPPSVSFSKQLGVYALSIFLPPLGLWPGIKYLLQNDQKVKTVGMIAIVLTIISTIFTLWITFAAFNQVNQTVQTQQQQLQELGL
jgi:hypothetical protein